jgi:ATP-dependent Clp protease protease subunit
MVAAIECCEIPVATICTTKCMSAGAVLFTFGDDGYRYMHPDATMMIHDAAWGTGGKIEDMKVDTKYLDDMNQRMFKKMAKHLNQKTDFILEMIKTKNHLDWFLTAKDAKKIGIANHLRVPGFDVTVSLDVQFG